MIVDVLYDKKRISKEYHSGWGVSFLVDKKILFDTGDNYDSLKENIDRIEYDIYGIKKIVISHNHWDHTGGLWKLLKRRKGVEVLVCPGVEKDFKDRIIDSGAKLTESEELKEVSPGIFLTGELEGEYNGKYMPEQGLIINTSNGVSLLTGCAHYRIDKMVKRIKKYYPQDDLYFVGGGFHLYKSKEDEINSIVWELKKYNIHKIGPSHCSGEDALKTFSEEYGKNFLFLCSGSSIRI